MRSGWVGHSGWMAGWAVLVGHLHASFKITTITSPPPPRMQVTQVVQMV